MRRLRATALTLFLLAGTTVLVAPAQGAGLIPSECPQGLTVRSPIAIRTEMDWTQQNGVRSGTGTVDDPYVISCWSISVTFADAIAILPTATFRTDDELTTVAPIIFTIHNVKIVASNSNLARGLVFTSSTEAKVRNNSVEGTNVAIDATGINVHILDNLLDRNTTGISFGSKITSDSRSPYPSAGALISGNSVKSRNCISAPEAIETFATWNTCTPDSLRGGTGIALGSGSLAQGNTVEWFDDGFVVSGTTLLGNTSRNNSLGLRSLGSNTIDSNVFSNNSEGIVLEGSGDAVRNNTIRDGYHFGMRVSEAASNSIQGNSITNNNGDGLELTGGAVGNVIANNSISANNGVGLGINGDATSNTISNNFINSNNGGGIDIVGDAYLNTITGNTITLNNGGGIDVIEATYNIIDNNIIQRNNGIGIGIIASYNTINHNTIERNNGRGIDVRGRFNTLRGNRIGSPSGDGIMIWIDPEGNLIEQTVWTDGDQSLSISPMSYKDCYPNNPNSAGENSVVDAGSNKLRFGPGSVTFADYYADVSLMPGPLGVVPEYHDQISVTWNFGDGSPPQTSAFKGGVFQAPCTPAFTHTYQEEGTFTVRLTVSTTTVDGESHSFSDEVIVTVA